jgi:hypothetical protein
MTLDHKPWTLADMADCASPDTLESPGAKFLERVQDDVNERDADSFSGDYLHDAAHEIADNAPDVYTHARWLQFADLCAYNEEPEQGEWPSDLTNAAGIALYQIAYRLAVKLLEDRLEAVEDEGDDEEAV